MRPTLTESEILRLALVSVALGMIIGLMYDIFRMIRIFRKTDGKGRLVRTFDFVLCFFEDLIFFLAVTVLNILMLSAYGGGTLRLEALMIQLCVFIMWQLSVGRLSIRLSIFLRGLLARWIKFIIRPIKTIVSKQKGKQRERQLRKYDNKQREKLKRDFRAP